MLSSQINVQKNTFNQIKADVIRPNRDANLYNLWTFLQNPKAE
jgi:hypothetical protein